MRRVRAAWPAIRIVVSAAMLVILFTRLDGDDRLRAIVSAHKTSTLLWFAGALAVTIVGIVISAFRWQAVLSALELRARVRTLLRHYLAGLFVSNFLPSTIGGDVLRVSRLSASNGQTSTTFASVVLERLTGWLVLPVISLVALAVNPSLWRLVPASKAAVAVAVATLVLLAGVLVAAAHPKLGGRLAQRSGWLRFLGAVHLGIGRLRRHPWAAASVLLVGFAYQLAVVSAAFTLGKALGLHVGPTAMLAFIPIVAIVQVIPITVGGLGVREGVLAVFLGPLGVASGDAIALGLLFYAVNLIASLLGAPAFALDRSRRAMA